MNKVFVGGSRRISRLAPEVRKRIDQIMERQLCILVGDANGADKAVQAYLKEHNYPRVIVFCTAGECRNNVADWQVRSVRPPHKAKDFAFFAAKDAAMANDADGALMLWDGKSAGTIINVARMIKAGKPAVVYVTPTRSFRTLRTPSELESLRTVGPADAWARIDRYLAEQVSEEVQATIF